LEKSSVGVQDVQVAVSEMSTDGSIVTLNAFPPTIWCRCVDGIWPGLTSLPSIVVSAATALMIRSLAVNLRVQPFYDQLRAGEAECGRSDSSWCKEASGEEE
jgi:hypothetical protein